VRTALHQRAALLIVLVLPASIGAIGIDAHARRRARELDRPSIDALSPRLPASDLALSGGARWLRFPSLEEPGAAFQDGPALPDPDPAGGAMAPPLEIWREPTPNGGAETRR
jgi:hypothetical protein